MTRVEQWLKRRGKMIQRGERAWNARPRGGGGYGPYPGNGKPMHAGGWPTHGGNHLKLPVLLARTFRKQMHDLTGGSYGTLVSPVGYKSPPHYTTGIDPDDLPYPQVHNRREQIAAGVRNVKIRTGKTGRIRGQGYVAYVAWIYFKKRGYWPTWDPKHRTPVDPHPAGDDDDW